VGLPYKLRGGFDRPLRRRYKYLGFDKMIINGLLVDWEVKNRSATEGRKTTQGEGGGYDTAERVMRPPGVR